MPDSKDFSEILKQPFARQLEQISGQRHLAQKALTAAEQQAHGYSEPERKAAHRQIRLLHVKFARFQQLRRPIALNRPSRALQRMKRFTRFFSYYPQVVRWRLTNAGLWLWLNLLQILLWIKARLPKIF